MRILCSLRKQPARRRPLLTKMIWTAAVTAPPALFLGAAQAQTAGVNPVSFSVGSNVYNVTVSNTNIDGGTVAVGNNSTSNTTVLQDFIDYASANGGGTVEIPTSGSSIFKTGELFLMNDVNLQIDTGATLLNSAPTTTFISTNGTTQNIEITGGGILNNNATKTSGNNMLNLQHITDLVVNDVTIKSASHEHLVPEADTNVTINDVTITDQNLTLANTDGIDFSGTNFLIENSNIADGDDDIVAKPSSTACSTIAILNDVIGVGHGISIGGQTNSGLINMTVNNITFNGTTNGLRLKAGIPNGGIVQNVSFSNITMNGVTNPIIISSWYDGGDHYGSNELSASQLDNPLDFNAANPGDPTTSVNESNNAAAYPFFDNISYTNITATGGSGNVAIIYGLNSTDTDPADPLRNIDNVSFNNVHLNGTYGADIYYTSDLNISGLTVNATNAPNENLFGDSFAAVPEPTSAGLLGTFGLMALSRRRGRRRKCADGGRNNSPKV